MRSKTFNPALIFLLALLVAALACGPFGGGVAEDAEDASAEGSQPTYGGLNLERAGDYSATFSAEFAPAEQNARAWTYSLETVVSGGTRYDLSMDGVDPSQNAGDVTLIAVGDTQYMTGPAVGAAGCLTYSGDLDVASSLLTPDDFVPPVEVSGLWAAAGSQTVAGQAGTLYELDAPAVGDFENVSGAMVLADDGAYVLRYEFAGDTAETRFAGGEAGRVTWLFEVTDLAPAGVAAPEDCEIDLPVMPGAEDLTRLPGLIAYSTASSAEEVVAFYVTALEADGWAQYAFPGESEDATVLTYARAGELLSVSVKSVDGGSEVLLFLEEQ